MERLKGRIIRGVGGFYYVDTPEGVLEAHGRGNLKRGGLLMVGDLVEVTNAPAGCVIERILPRTSEFRRPPIANCDLLLVTSAVRNPAPNLDLLDRFLVMAQAAGVESLLCLTKVDLATEEECEALTDRFRGAAPTLLISAREGRGVDQLRALLTDRRAAFAGPSGVGKSTLTNLLVPGAAMETGGVSDKTRRGRHTTRHVEIFRIPGGGLLYDTPGFTSFDLTGLLPEELAQYLPDFQPCLGGCRFDDCRHLKEPGCAVRQAVEEGRIHPDRYASYVRMFEDLKKQQDMKWR